MSRVKKRTNKTTVFFLLHSQANTVDNESIKNTMTIGTLKTQTGKQKMPKPLSGNFEASVPSLLYASLSSDCVKLFCIIKQLQHPQTLFCTASNKTLGHYAGIAQSTVRKHLKLLREAGFLSVRLEVKGDGVERKFYRFLHVSNDRIDTCREIVRNFDDKGNTKQIEGFENNEDADCEEQDEARDADTGEEIVSFEAQKGVQQAELIPPETECRRVKEVVIKEEVRSIDANRSKTPAMPSRRDDDVDFDATYQEGTKPFHWCVAVFLRLKDQKPSESAFRQWYDCEDWRYASNTFKRTVKRLYDEGWRYDDRFFKPVPPDIDQTMVNALVTHAEEIANPKDVKNLKDPLYAILVGEKETWEEKETKKPDAERKPFPYNGENYFTFPFAQWIKDNAERLVKAWEPLTRNLLKAANCYCWSFPESDFAGIIDKYFPKPYNWAA